MKKINLLFFSLLAITFIKLSAQEVNTNFIVFSDPHYYDASLGVNGEAFSNYLDGDRKLLKESKELLAEAVKFIESSDAEFVIVPGDLTKDGTLISHTEFAKMMIQLEKCGKQVYVVPGNHDVSNGESKAYRGDKEVTVENISPEKFKSIYKSLGYEEALFKDPNSLSYVAEAAPGLWLFALDPCLYKQNVADHHPITDGEFSEETLLWIEEIAIKAKEQNKEIIAMMHQGIIEHYKKQSKFFGEYVVNDYKKVSKKFATLGINHVFTGHYHAQDISKKEWRDGSYIYDIETGSLVTYPCPLRKVSLSNSSMKIKSHFITSIPSYEDGFVEFSKEYVHSGISGIAEKVMVSMHLKPEEAKKLSGQIGDAFIAHYQGDEPLPDHKYLDLKGIGLLGKIMILTKRRLIVELYNDIPPADNDLKIDMKR